MKKILLGSLLFGALFTACSSDDDYNAGIAKPQASDATVTHSFGSGSVTEVGLINLAEVESEAVKVAEIVAPTMTSATAKIDSMCISFLDVLENNVTTIDAEGQVSTDFLTKIVESVYGKRPEERSIGAVVSAFLSDGDQSFLINSEPFIIKVIPPAPDIEAAYYLTGSINGWDNTNTAYKLTNNGGDPYENPTYTCRIPAPADGSDIEFKMTPESGIGGDWSGCLAGGSADGTFVYNNAGGNLVIPAAAGAYFYDFTFNMMDLTWSYKAVSFDAFVYFIGATDGWANAEQKLALTDQDAGIYTGYVYCADPNGWGNCFKFQKVAGDWGTEINTGHMTGGMTGSVGFHDGDTNFEIKDGEGVYFLTLNLSDNTLSALKVEKMGIIGDFNGWGGDVEMTWNATDYCFEATGAGVNANGWKFRVNSDWGINLGSNDSVEPSTVLTDLVANGKNIGVAGNTIKLYPTRKTSDNIYCTVE